MVKTVIVTKYQSADGTLYDTAKAAEAHDREMEKKEIVSKIDDVLYSDFNDSYFWDDLRRTGDMDPEDALTEISKLIINNWDKLKEVLE